MNLLALGIDIAKLKFNVCLIREDGRLRHKVFANTAAGFSQLSAWLTAPTTSRRCMLASKPPARTVRRWPLT